jgi:chromosomal replication initiation ATPase DnaA
MTEDVSSYISVELLSKFINIYDKLGQNKTTELLSTYQMNYFDFVRKLIIRTTCDFFQISEHDLLHGRTRGERYEAQSVAIYFLKDYLKLSHGKLISDFNKNSRATITKCLGFISKLDVKLKSDRLVFEKIQYIRGEIDKQIENFNIKKAQNENR